MKDVDNGKSTSPLEGNTFGIELEGTVDDKIKRLLALIPLSFQILDESYETIKRLRKLQEVDETHDNEE